MRRDAWVSMPGKRVGRSSGRQLTELARLMVMNAKRSAVDVARKGKAHSASLGDSRCSSSPS